MRKCISDRWWIYRWRRGGFLLSGAFLATLPWQRSSFKLYAYGNSKKQDIKQGPTEVMCFVAERGENLSLSHKQTWKCMWWMWDKIAIKVNTVRDCYLKQAFSVFVCFVVRCRANYIIPGQPFVHFGMQIASCHTWSHGTSWWCHGEANFVGVRVRERPWERVNIFPSLFPAFPCHPEVARAQVCYLNFNEPTAEHVWPCVRSMAVSLLDVIFHMNSWVRKKEKKEKLLRQDDKTWYDSVDRAGYWSREGKWKAWLERKTKLVSNFRTRSVYLSIPIYLPINRCIYVCICYLYSINQSHSA